TFSRKNVPGTEAIDLNDMVERTGLLVSYELQARGTELIEERAEGELPVRGNHDELQQVLLNLVTNAGHAVRDLPEGAPRRITIVTARENNQAVLRVRDTGPGIPAASIPQLFTPFFTTKDPGEGTGLGLSLSYRIAEGHHGRLSYQAAPGGGAEFILTLPIDTDGQPVKAAPPVAIADRAALLVDGDPGSELVVRALFEPAGFEVEVARS